jgi:hypothetical protein
MNKRVFTPDAGQLIVLVLVSDGSVSLANCLSDIQDPKQAFERYIGDGLEVDLLIETKRSFYIVEYFT